MDEISSAPLAQAGVRGVAGPSFPAMEPSEHPRTVHIGVGPDGSLTYLVDLPPEELPPVHKRDLERAWHAAHDAAQAKRWGSARGFRFRRDDGSYTDLALADRDARCWAGAVDVTVGMRNSYGLSVCLRLLALVDLLARVRWADPLCRLQRDGADLHPVLLRAAATTPLTQDARFDETGFRSRLARFAFGFALEGPTASRLTGASP
ncbi:MAG TPA: hypothetical protein VHT74_03005 [Acetobacteraceae bacterium]|jgi:hypothetical protein|nr:hypothetical protein [Acetobacteraceae bacterium]